MDSMSDTKKGNPAVVGLAGFGMTTLLLQFHNLGIAGLGPVLAMGLIFGGLAQLIAGFMEFKTGNNSDLQHSQAMEHSGSDLV